jgi:two-component system response regulator YesN
MSINDTENTPIRVIIVDDEPLVREGLFHMLKWDALDCQVVGQAENGIEAIELVKAISPDIVITDIMMPGINGLELTDFIMRNNHGTQVIILTGYNEFSFAQEAIKVGAADFVLKPTKVDELEKIIMSKREIIIKLRREKRMTQELENKLIFGKPHLLSKFLSDLMQTDMEKTDHIIKNMEFLGLKMFCYAIVKIKLERYREQSEKSNEVDIIKCFSLLEEELKKEILVNHLKYVNFKDEHSLRCLIYSDWSIDLTDFESRLTKITEGIIKKSKTAQYIACIGRSRTSTNIRYIPESLCEASKNLCNVSFIGDSSISIPRYERIIPFVMDYIEKHCNEQIFLKDVADAFFVSQGHLSRQLKKSTSMTFTEILTGYRIEKAKKLLKEPTCRVCEVAQNVGFTDSRHFSQVFRKAVGMTPSAYRSF